MATIADQYPGHTDDAINCAEPASQFVPLVEHQIPSLRRYAVALTRDRERADDLVQDCLVRALTKQHLWQPETDLRAWLFTILHNSRVSELRRLAREKSRNEIAAGSFSQMSRHPDRRIELLDLDHGIGKLPERQRHALLLVCLEGISYEQAGWYSGRTRRHAPLKNSPRPRVTTRGIRSSADTAAARRGFCRPAQ